MPISNVYNMDCMEAMKKFEDGFFDLAVVDPPYGSGGGMTTTTDSEDDSTHTNVTRTGGTWAAKFGKKS